MSEIKKNILLIILFFIFLCGCVEEKIIKVRVERYYNGELQGKKILKMKKIGETENSYITTTREVSLLRGNYNYLIPKDSMKPLIIDLTDKDFNFTCYEKVFYESDN